MISQEKSPVMRGFLSSSLFHLGLLVVLNSNPRYQVELGFQPVDMLFFGFQNAVEQVPADEVLAGFTVFDCLAQIRNGFHLQGQIAFKHFLRVLTDP